jgi:acetylornithine/N-succinyldiaminopimelate aminotransferase
MSITPLMPVYPRCGVRPVRGEGAFLYGERGEAYLDMAAGIAVNILGHSHPAVVKAIADQAATLMHVSNLYGMPLGEKFAEALLARRSPTRCSSPIRAPRRSTARSRPRGAIIMRTASRERHRIITFSNAFHGRTLGAISATDQPKMREGFEPLLPGFTVLRFNDLEGAKAAIGPDAAGFMLETIQGEGGILAATPEFLTGLRACATSMACC